MLAALVGLALAAGAIWFHHHLRQSLPALDGEIALAGLAAPVTVGRDASGVATIRGTDRRDVARALGFVHAQERFFQMDLIRRKAAGELAELVGAAALPLDRQVRVHRFRARARAVVEAFDEADRRLLDAYVEGVNAGLAALAAPPFEYAVLRAGPAPWRPEDTVLAVYAMYLDLQGNGGQRELARGVAHAVLPPPLYEFLTPEGTEWDAPVDGEPFAAPRVPPPEEFDLRRRPSWEQWEPKVARHGAAPEDPGVELGAGGYSAGSNNWAVAGRHTAHGGALLASDMHLGHGVPNIWYRTSLAFPDPGGGGERRVSGVTLPGAMLVVAGTNGEIAWGLTNSYGDWTDLVVLEPDPADADAYLTPDGPRRFERHREELRAKGGESETLEVVETIWGPVWGVDHRGRRLAMRWVAHDLRGANLALQGLETAGDVDRAIAAAGLAGIPAQNFVVVDSGGRIGWTIMGPIPRRFGHDGTLPSSWADGRRGWDGWLWPEEYPRIVDPESGRIWTANARVVGGEMLERLGDGGYDLGARARQIRDRLFGLDRPAEQDLLGVQLDDRAVFLERWRELLEEVLTPEAVAGDPRRRELRRLLAGWSGRAGVDSAAYRLVRGFRLTLRDQVFETLTAPCRAADERFRFHHLGQDEGPLWRLASERPPHLLSPRFAGWQEQFLAAADALLGDLLEDGGELAEKTWGARNRARIRHPLSPFLPLAGRWLDMPATPLPGDSDMPRVQGPSFGASERMVVSPGRVESGIFHMPTGQSGHPLSPHYRDGHAAWEEGHPTGFLPGPAVHTLILKPRT